MYLLSIRFELYEHSLGRVKPKIEDILTGNESEGKKQQKN